jgi:hypothetical protein
MTKESDKLATIKLDGTGITGSGEEKKTKFFKTLAKDIDNYDDISFTPDEAIAINNHISKLQTGSTAIVPLICAGLPSGDPNDPNYNKGCPFSDRCVFCEMGKPPLLRACLLETNMLKYWVLQFMQEYEVDPENMTEVLYCNELSEIEIYLWRLNNNLAKPTNAELVVDQPIGTDRDGNPILQKQLSPFMEAKEKLLNRKSKIIKLMVGDRESRYKKEAALKKREDGDASTQQAELRRKIDDLNRRISKMSTIEEDGKISEPETILTPDALLSSFDEDDSKQ